MYTVYMSIKTLGKALAKCSQHIQEVTPLPEKSTLIVEMSDIH